MPGYLKFVEPVGRQNVQVITNTETGNNPESQLFYLKTNPGGKAMLQ